VCGLHFLFEPRRTARPAAFRRTQVSGPVRERGLDRDSGLACEALNLRSLGFRIWLICIRARIFSLTIEYNDDHLIP